jgi:hypothetical protein
MNVVDCGAFKMTTKSVQTGRQLRNVQDLKKKEHRESEMTSIRTRI